MNFDARIGAAALIGAGGLYMTLSLATDHSARAEPAPDLVANEAGLDLWRAVHLLVEEQDVAMVDVRSEGHFAAFHVPQSIHVAGATAARVRQQTHGKSHVLLLANDDATAARLVGRLAQDANGTRFHFLQGGAQAWYLSLELPVVLFADKPPPYGYEQAMAVLRAWLDDPQRFDEDEVKEAVSALASLAYVPNEFGDKKPKATGKRKRIVGGCG